jgi:uridine kinase
MTKKPMLILIGGGTCSGKSTLAQKAARFFPEKDFVLLGTDDYVGVKINVKGKEYIDGMGAEAENKELQKILSENINAIIQEEYK